MSKDSIKKILKKALKYALVLLGILILISGLLDITPINKFLQNRFQHRLEAALSQALGRSVKGGNLDFTILSGLGFNMEGVSISEAPGFGGEQFLYAEKIHFVLSWNSFLARKFELSRITLTRASINLVRNGEGRWNIEAWFSGSGTNRESPPATGLGQTRIPSASGAIHPLVIKIYFDTDRINFKDLSGTLEKKVIILAEVNGKIEPAWFSNGIDFDLKMKPSRTDVSMENSGFVRVTGSLGPFRNSSLWSAVIQGQARLEKFPYSDVVAIVTGRATDLHGLLDGRASFLGPLSELIRVRGQIDLVDLHSRSALPREKYKSASLVFSKLDLKPGESFSLSEASLSVGTSQMMVKGKVDRFPVPQVKLDVESEKIQMEDLLNVVRGFTVRLPDRTHLLGEAKMEFHLTGSWNSPVAAGQMGFSQGQIQSQWLSKPMDYAPFSASLDGDGVSWDAIQFGDRENQTLSLSGSIADIKGIGRLSVEAVGREVGMDRVESILRSFGLWSPPVRVEGMVDFSIRWGPSHKLGGRPLLTASVNARNITVKLGTPDAIRVASARFESKNDLAQLNAIKVNWGRSVTSGSMQFSGLDFHRAQVSLSANFLDVNELLRLGTEARNFLLSQRAETRLPTIDFSRTATPAFSWFGKLTSPWLYFRQLQVTNLRSDFKLEKQALQLNDFAFDAYGGKSKGNLRLDWESGQPRLHVEGIAENVRLDSLLNLSTPLGPAVKGRASGEFTLTGEKVKGQDWRKSLMTHVRISIRDLENVSLKIPSSLADLRSRLNLSPSPASKDSPMTLDLNFDLTPERVKITQARLTRSDFIGTFSGGCSRKLDLDLSGSVEKIVSKKSPPSTSIAVIIQGSLDQAEVTVKGQNPPH